MNSRTPETSTASHRRTTRSAGKSPSVTATLVAALVGHLLLAALVAPVVVAVAVGAGVLLAAVGRLVTVGLGDRLGAAPLRRRAAVASP